MPGHGRSGIIDNIHTMDLMAESINHLLNELKIKKCVIIGHSMGGYVTLAFLEKFKEKLLGFSLFHSVPFGDTDEKKKDRDRETGIE